MRKSFIFFPCLILILFTRCKKESSQPQPGPPLPYNVYISGSTGSGNSTQAVYWKNDTMHTLASGGLPSLAGNIIYSDSDVYVSGVKGDSTGYWKNGVFVSLNDTTNYGDLIAVSGTNIYATINTKNGNIYRGGYYKNGQYSRISSVDSVSTLVTSIAVRGQDLLIGYTETNGTKPAVAKYWLNGLNFTLSDGTRPAYVFGVAFDGSDIYAVGAELDTVKGFSTAKYWKNGVPTNVSDTTGYNVGLNIVISGTDIYVAGYGHDGSVSSGNKDAARYWKNGTAATITDGVYEAKATSLAITGSDVFVIYQEFQNGASNSANYVKNGNKLTLKSPSPAVASYCFITPP